MSLKLHMLHLHLAFFKSNRGAYLEEHGEHFQQDILVFKKNYQGEYNACMVGDYIWGQVCDTKHQYTSNHRKFKYFERTFKCFTTTYFHLTSFVYFNSLLVIFCYAECGNMTVYC